MRGRYPKLPASGIGLCVSCKRWEVVGDNARCLDCELYIAIGKLGRERFLRALTHDDTAESGESYDLERNVRGPIFKSET